METLSALRRRRTHRMFDPGRLDERTLQTLAWAATRAPAGGNQPTRVVLVIEEPALIGCVTAVTPSYIGTPPAVIICILTDLDAAERQMGAHGRDQLARTDAGAAAENVVLAAVDLGLGAYMFRSSNDAALAAALNLPATVRAEVLVAVGRVGAERSPAIKAPPQPVFRDRWGQPWEVTRP